MRMKKTLVTIIVTAIVTSIFWHVVTSVRRAVDAMWLESAVKAPGRMAFDEILDDLAAGRHEAARAKLDVLRTQWRRFESEDDFRGEGIGNILLEFPGLPNGEAEESAESIKAQSPAAPPETVRRAGTPRPADDSAPVNGNDGS